MARERNAASSLPAAVLVATALALAACTSTSKREGSAPSAPASTSPSAKSGGYYKDDGPGDNPPANLDALPDAMPRLEPLSRFSNRPYSVFGVEYVPATTLRPYNERGIASWYGRKFHNQKTSNGETYDMYAMTAAHPTLPLPSYARVTNVATGKSVVVRVNDRGPFHPGRVIDLSYAAAYRIGIAQQGSGQVQVESIIPGDAPPQVAVAPLPSVASAETAPAAAMPVGQQGGEYAVQLGAFANNANAQAFVEHVANQIAPLGVQTRVRQDRGLFRVSVGPYPTRDEAARVAARLREALGLDSTIRAQ
ncbi:MAG: septal ring lytic transglycosylase RlpA family protein [Casimicrobiaceae bacterium]